MCGWCQESNSCQVQEQCRHHATLWLNRQQTCPDPKVLNFHPKLGPWEGGTNITIEGINLGRTFEDIATGIGIEFPSKLGSIHNLFNSSVAVIQRGYCE